MYIISVQRCRPIWSLLNNISTKTRQIKYTMVTMKLSTPEDFKKYYKCQINSVQIFRVLVLILLSNDISTTDNFSFKITDNFSIEFKAVL